VSYVFTCIFTRGDLQKSAVRRERNGVAARVKSAKDFTDDKMTIYICVCVCARIMSELLYC